MKVAVTLRGKLANGPQFPSQAELQKARLTGYLVEGRLTLKKRGGDLDCGWSGLVANLIDEWRR